MFKQSAIVIVVDIKIRIMKAKEKYLEQTEIKVKNLLSELYETESAIQKEIMKTKDKLNDKLFDLESDYSELFKKRKELQKKFDQLKFIGDSQWENARNDFDLLLKYVEGDRETFIKKAELVIKELGDKIQEIEDKTIDTASDVKNDLAQKVNEMKISKQELQEKIDTIKSDTGDRWREIKHWFLEKSNSAKEYISSI
jgi:peptidoglycan hydrolase CwlO-like protein